jgi:hypothetical protein
MEFSIIVATYDRHEFLQRLLSSIEACFGKAGVEHEVIVANNAPSEAMAGAVENIVKEFLERATVDSVKSGSPRRVSAGRRILPLPGRKGQFSPFSTTTWK